VSTALIRVSHRLSLTDWEVMSTMMTDTYDKLGIDKLAFGIKSTNELPLIEHALLRDIPIDIRLYSFDQVVALMPHAMRLLTAINGQHTTLAYWGDTDRKTSQLRWQMSYADAIIVVRDLGDWRLYRDDVDLALELELDAYCVDLTRGSRSRLTRKEGP
jgi:hypothetical protein